jgi:flagellar assembly factor FliW
MKIVTSQFGEIEFSEDSLIFFPRGTIGFESCHRFLVIDNEAYKPFKGLLSIDNDKAGFPVLNPFMLNADFGKEIPPALLEQLLSADEEVDIFCIVNLNSEDGKPTINLRSPIIVDYRLKKGEQIILDTDNLPVAMPIL